MILQFVNRKNELEILEGLKKKKKGALVLIYGRRRIGKTRLIKEFLKNKAGLYFYVLNAEEKGILDEFSRVVEKDFFKGFKFADINAFMEYLVKKQEEGTIIAIDEFQRLINIEGAISMLQKFWDEKMSNINNLFIISGSAMGYIQRVALRGDAPLYGRRTATLKIEPLKYLDLFEWFKKYSAEELVQIYGAFGGTPAYLEKVNENIDIEQNIIENILSKHSPLYDEPEMLLLEEIRAPQRYMDILSAISLGKNTLSLIGNATGLNRENTTTYLKTLNMLGLIERITPITKPRAKKGLYKLKDPFFAFWFRFVRYNKRHLELELEQNVWNGIKDDFNGYLGCVFEEICKEILVEMAKKDVLPIQIEKIGNWWLKETEIDILGLGRKSTKALAIEAKWRNLDYNEVKKILRKLMIKMEEIQTVKEWHIGVMAKKIENKEKLRNEGFFALDLQDIIKEVPNN
ncbi:MAG: ATP-binding protein [Candidatus Helarchaeota archaeon]